MDEQRGEFGDHVRAFALEALEAHPEIRAVQATGLQVTCSFCRSCLL